jgi:hypothetical protein
MNQHSIALYLERKGLKEVGIYQDLVATLGPQAAACSTLTFDIRSLSFRVEEDDGGDQDLERCTNDVDVEILISLADESFSSVREFA